MTQRWEPRVEVTAQERVLLKTTETTKKLFGFLLLHRREVFDDKFQDELASVYRATRAPGIRPTRPR